MTWTSSTASTHSSTRSTGSGSALGRAEITPTEEHERLRRVEVELDQCWDLLRQRRARREYGRDPHQAEARPEGTVEGYLG